MIKKISHLGMAVKNLEEAREFYRSVLKLESSDPIIGGDGTLKVSMVPVGEVLIELIEPIGTEGVIARFLESRGEGIHHISIEVDDIVKSLESLSAQGIRLIDEVPRDGIEGKIAFIHPKSMNGVLIELVEKPK